jgi:hypothetical protein
VSSSNEALVALRRTGDEFCLATASAIVWILATFYQAVSQLRPCFASHFGT